MYANERELNYIYNSKLRTYKTSQSFVIHFHLRATILELLWALWLENTLLFVFSFIHHSIIRSFKTINHKLNKMSGVPTNWVHAEFIADPRNSFNRHAVWSLMLSVNFDIRILVNVFNTSLRKLNLKELLLETVCLVQFMKK